MYKNRFDREKNSTQLRWLLLLLFAIFYPMFTSIYTILPPLIGVVGLFIIYNMEKNSLNAFLGMLYLVNLDFNAGLPLLLSLVVIVLIYILIYPSAKLIINCKRCLAIFLIIFIDILYYVTLFIYDFIFSLDILTGDSTLLFYIIIDLIIGLLL
ncbi:MAG: hypothetical protein KAG56_02725 [Sulfurovaceae bacterium]|nr:hypothetical protein [Sulfurovaceae bacterium]